MMAGGPQVASEQVVMQLRSLLAAARDTGSYDGHDRMLVRQMGLLLYMVNRPRTGETPNSVETLVPAMDADLEMLYRRLSGEETQ